MNKHYLVLSAALLLSGAAHAQGTELFFSEYDEGAHQNGVSYGGATTSTGSERAIEIYNPTTSTVSLNAYSVRRYANGSATPTEEERLVKGFGTANTNQPNTMNTRTTFVLASGEATLPVIRNAANQFSVGHAPVSGPTVIIGGGTVYFNGNDAMALVRYPSGTAGVGNGIIVDLIGVIGQLPQDFTGAATTSSGNWRGTNPLDSPYPGTTYIPNVVSENQSLTRRASVSRGVQSTVPTVYTVTPPSTSYNYSSGYNIADEWVTYSYSQPPGGVANPGGQLYDQLGQHNDYAGPYGTYQTTISGTLEKFNANISIYPNPAHGTATVEIKDAKVGSITVMNNLGQRIGAQAKGAGQEKLTLDVSSLKPGLYFVQIWSADGQTKIYKELVVQ
ncbi:T9SS type A sorting domain-containing protein [Hymenobacter sp. M29]|uniref:T9SS type A sorting domain-containing protein n=1 Tax=Hymenobacter mellowenesis TaxID=3063995 RepID=A0ABT9A8S7_9BACT|nr:T9SS type A sorting domain-containing protein [Hymenobacter sp. M29]MDO7845615.1 T9SS type A sorting domain-containing protein [Hymenobacter sp. M29]